MKSLQNKIITYCDEVCNKKNACRSCEITRLMSYLDGPDKPPAKSKKKTINMKGASDQPVSLTLIPTSDNDTQKIVLTPIQETFTVKARVPVKV